MPSSLSRELELPQIDWPWPLVGLGWTAAALLGLASLALGLDIVFAVTGDIDLWRALFGPVFLIGGGLLVAATVWRIRLALSSEAEAGASAAVSERPVGPAEGSRL